MTTAPDDTAAETEESARELVVRAGRWLAEQGLARGTAGNLSVRHGETILVTPTGAELGAIEPGALAVLDLDGTHLSGPRPSKEYPLHRALYRRDPAARAVVHLHSRRSTAVSCLPAWSPRSAVPPITPYFVMRVGQVPLIPYADPGDARQAAKIEGLPFPFRAALLQNHGPVTAGHTMAAALDVAAELEESCAILLELGAHRPVVLSEGVAASLARRYGSPWSPEASPATA